MLCDRHFIPFQWSRLNPSSSGTSGQLSTHQHIQKCSNSTNLFQDWSLLRNLLAGSMSMHSFVPIRLYQLFRTPSLFQSFLECLRLRNHETTLFLLLSRNYHYWYQWLKMSTPMRKICINNIWSWSMDGVGTRYNLLTPSWLATKPEQKRSHLLPLQI